MKEQNLNIVGMIFWATLVITGTIIFLQLEDNVLSGKVSGSSEEAIYDDGYLQGRERYYSDDFYEDYYQY